MEILNDDINKQDAPYIIKDITDLKERFWDRSFICVTGIRPSWKLHIWHYVGALENWLKLQLYPNIKNNFIIADYQVLGDHLWETKQLRQSVIDVVIDWLALWLNPENTNFIIQSYVPELAELFNFLTMFVPYSVATNNPTLKDEMKKIEARWKWLHNSISLGFINYPISQVADIMLFKWEIIPVGDDQIPHIELARKIIKKVNTLYKTNFPLPLALLSKTSRLVWVDGNDKMSKSLWNTISLSSTFAEIKAQVNKMYTDPEKTSIDSKWNTDKHIVFLYLDLFYSDKFHLADLKRRYVEWGRNSIGDGELKALLTKVLEELIAPIRERRKYYEQNMDIVIKAIEEGSARGREEGKKMITELKQSMWLLKYWN